VICSDEYRVELGKDNRVLIWLRPGEKWTPPCLNPGRGVRVSLMIWGCITYEGVGTLTVVDGNINAQKYIEVIDNFVRSVIARHFPDDKYYIYHGSYELTYLNQRIRRMSCLYKFTSKIHGIYGL
jgi:hypothetical protein